MTSNSLVVICDPFNVGLNATIEADSSVKWCQKPTAQQWQTVILRSTAPTFRFKFDDEFAAKINLNNSKETGENEIPLRHALTFSDSLSLLLTRDTLKLASSYVGFEVTLAEFWHQLSSFVQVQFPQSRSNGRKRKAYAHQVSQIGVDENAVILHIDKDRPQLSTFVMYSKLRWAAISKENDDQFRPSWQQAGAEFLHLSNETKEALQRRVNANREENDNKRTGRPINSKPAMELFELDADIIDGKVPTWDDISVLWQMLPDEKQEEYIDKSLQLASRLKEWKTRKD